jgi:murein DD-endopeptidase MepM/ murein hydrolase activator NlpD
MAKLPDSFYKEYRDITKVLNTANSIEEFRAGISKAYTQDVKRSLGISKGSYFDKVISPKSDKKTSSVESISSSTVRVLSKNSMFLPVIAKEMNIMRQNIQLMVKRQGLIPKNKSDSSLTSTGQTSSVPSATKSGKSKGSFFGGSSDSEDNSGDKSSMFSGMGVLRLLSKGRLLLPALIGLLSAGYLTSVLYRALPFRKIASDFTKIFNDALSGMAQFFGLDGFLGDTIEKIRKFFGMKEDEGFLDVIARKLDETFKTTFFSANLNRAGNLIRNAAEDTVIFLKNAYATIMKYVSATMMTTADLMDALARDVKNYLLIWLDSNRLELYTVIGGVLGAILGSIVGSVGALAGGAIGAAYGKQRAEHDENEKNKIIAQNEGNIEAPFAKANLIAANLKNYMDFHTKAKSSDAFVEGDLSMNPDVLKTHAKLQGFDENYYVGMRGLDMSWVRKEYEKATHTSRVLGGALLAKQGTHEVENFDLRKRYGENLKSAEGMYPLEKYPTRAYPVNTLDYRKPEGIHAFGANRTNTKGQSYKHGGVDFLGNVGDPIYAMHDGVVQVKNQPKGMGKYIIIKGVNGSTVYGHLREDDKYLKVKTGDSVKYGQQIAEMGDSGNANGKPQLHFEAYSGDAFTSTRLNPEEFLKGLPARPTMDSPTGNKNSLISDVTQSAEKNFIDPLVKKFDEMIAAFMAKDTNVVVNTSSESIPAEPYSEEQLANYKLSGINF